MKSLFAALRMADVVSKEVRSRMMAGIRGKDTKPELILRRGLHTLGFRYRLHTSLPGRPDLVFSKHNAVLFANGCFWHGHDCHLFKWPKSRVAFWHDKINGNVARDARNIAVLRDEGWRVGVVWECALKGRTRLEPTHVIERCSSWLRAKDSFLELAGRHEKGSAVGVFQIGRGQTAERGRS